MGVCSKRNVKQDDNHATHAKRASDSKQIQQSRSRMRITQSTRRRCSCSCSWRIAAAALFGGEHGIEIALGNVHRERAVGQRIRETCSRDTETEKNEQMQRKYVDATRTVDGDRAALVQFGILQRSRHCLRTDVAGQQSYLADFGHGRLEVADELAGNILPGSRGTSDT